MVAIQFASAHRRWPSPGLRARSSRCVALALAGRRWAWAIVAQRFIASTSARRQSGGFLV
ncbi:MAG: hypothetical protein R2838_01760 [Caldilineaceae bacterium]